MLTKNVHRTKDIDIEWWWSCVIFTGKKTNKQTTTEKVGYIPLWGRDVRLVNSTVWSGSPNCTTVDSRHYSGCLPTASFKLEGFQSCFCELKSCFLSAVLKSCQFVNSCATVYTDNLWDAVQISLMWLVRYVSVGIRTVQILKYFQRIKKKQKKNLLNIYNSLHHLHESLHWLYKVFFSPF